MASIEELSRLAIKLAKRPEFEAIVRDTQFKLAMRLYQSHLPAAVPAYEVIFKIDPAKESDPGYRMQYVHLLTDNDRLLVGCSLQFCTKFRAYALMVSANKSLFDLAKARAVHNLAGSELSEVLFEKVVQETSKDDGYRGVAESMLSAIKASRDLPQDATKDLREDDSKLRRRVMFVIAPLLLIAGICVWRRRLLFKARAI